MSSPRREAASALPFEDFAGPLRPQSPLRARITAAYRRPEPECIAALIADATLPPDLAAKTARLARTLVETLRAKSAVSGVKALIQEYSLSSDEGIALMCLAEALLRIPDRATRDALIRDKLAKGDWMSHVGGSPSLFVEAATWGLVVSGKLLDAPGEKGLAAVLTALIARCGEPVIRNAVDVAMRLMGDQFVTGQTIEEALERSRAMEAKGFRYSYDMLGEAATTAQEAARYYADYERAIHAIGRASAGRGIIGGPGISIKLSALHPRYSRAQAHRVMAELLPRVKQLAAIAKRYDIGLNIDAEESERLEVSLDLLEALSFDPDLAGWDGVGFVVQAYGKRCPFVIDYVIDLARRSGRRVMVRLVKGAYWDSEIKKAQVEGLADFPVYTRKLHTDVAYIACARKLLAARDAVFPQFATHNAQTLASVIALGGEPFTTGQYEFQCLHGMGEALYEEVVGPDKLNRPCRIYAPVGTHETLLAYLVRRLLENGANSSFVNQVYDPDVSVAALTADPAALARAVRPLGAPHPKIALPKALFGPVRRNSAGVDIANEGVLTELAATFGENGRQQWRAAPIVGGAIQEAGAKPVLNPADHRDAVGSVANATPAHIDAAFIRASAAAPAWERTSASERAAILARTADLLEVRMTPLLALIIREAGKSLPNAVAEVREAVDFLRYYGAEAVRTLNGGGFDPVGPVVCISPWNFPLAIFTGQVAAALAAGNPVLAKPAEETPLIAAEAVRILHEAGVPGDVLHLLTGEGDVGAALVGHAGTRAVMFTGSTEVARIIQKTLARKLSPKGRPIPLIAETGGQNAMIVDSSALAEQVVGDVLSSAFDSAGQRCSALRVLCLQDDVADRILAMLKGAMNELVVGRPDRLATDVGPVITAEARDIILKHIDTMRAAGARVTQAPMADAAHGTFVPPTLIELAHISQLTREVFGPVLHVVRYARDDADKLMAEINATRYGLTFGLHTRLSESIDWALARIEAGNIYVNRNVIGAVVGVQPFGGRGLSGTGPKAGGPLYMRKLLENPPKALPVPPGPNAVLAHSYCDWLLANGRDLEAERCRGYAARAVVGRKVELPGPVGESNTYELRPRGRILLVPFSDTGLLLQLGAVLATGNDAVFDARVVNTGPLKTLPKEIAKRVAVVPDWTKTLPAAALVEGDGARITAISMEIAAVDGPVIPVQGLSSTDLVGGAADYNPDGLIEERAVSINTTAAGGNASLMALEI